MSEPDRRQRSMIDRGIEWLMRAVAGLALFFLSQIYQDTRATAAAVDELKVKVAVLEERTRHTREVPNGVR